MKLGDTVDIIRTGTITRVIVELAFVLLKYSVGMVIIRFVRRGIVSTLMYVYQQ